MKETWAKAETGEMTCSHLLESVLRLVSVTCTDLLHKSEGCTHPD